jgi:CHAD domain-containing protein
MFDSGSNNGKAAENSAAMPSAPAPAFELTRKSRADEAAASILLDLLGTIRENTRGAIAGKDPEALHDLRISVRRTRALQRELKHVFPPDQLEAFRDGFKWLQQLTSPVRDLDVLLGDLERWSFEHPELSEDLAFSIRLLRKQRTAERRKLKSGLTGARATNLLLDWEGLLKGLPQLDTADRPAAERPIGTVAAKRIRKRYKKILALGSELDDESPAADLHELRKRAKDLRYMVKYFGEFYPKKTIKPLQSDLSDLHDVLGGLQDTIVQHELLTAVADQLVAVQTRASALLAIGGLLEDMRFEQEFERDTFEDCFGSLAKRKQRRAIREI